MTANIFDKSVQSPLMKAANKSLIAEQHRLVIEGKKYYFNFEISSEFEAISFQLMDLDWWA